MSTADLTPTIVDVERKEIAAQDAHARLMAALRDLPALRAMWTEYMARQLEAFNARRALRDAHPEAP